MEIDPEKVNERVVEQVASTLVGPDPPSDFEAFWLDTVDMLGRTPLGLEVRYVDDKAAAERHVVFAEWTANSIGGRRIGGPLVLPEKVLGPQWVYGHGYGNTSGAKWFVAPARRGFISIGYDVRGYNRSRIAGDPGIPGWATSGIDDPRVYILRGAVADAIRTVEVARAISGADSRYTVLTGGSFSGGIAALATPWIADLAYVALRVPTFGAFRLRERLTIERGTGHEINRLLLESTPRRRERIRQVLRYFDAVNAASLIRDVPVTVGLGVSDVVVPAETVAAIYNAIENQDKELLVFPCSHCQHPLMSEWKSFESHLLQRGQTLCFAN